MSFQTNNMALALALNAGGIRILEQARYYTLEELERLGMTAAEAAAKDIGGRIEFYLEKTPALKHLLDAYVDEQKKTSSGLDVTPEQAVRLVCHAMKTRRQLAEDRRTPACARTVHSKGEPVKGENGSFTHPGLTIVSANVSAEDRKRLGV